MPDDAPATARKKPSVGPVQHRKISLSAKEGLKTSLDGIMAKYEKDIPGVAFGVTTADGIVYAGYQGDRVYGQPEHGPVDRATTYQIYSMTKLVTSLAVLQAVEAGELAYDDPGVLQQHAPELCAQPVLLSYTAEGGPVFEERAAPLTLRHLVTHTSGLAYWPFDPVLGGYLKSVGRDVMYAPTAAQLVQPLRAQPGARFAYGAGLDWAGIVLERATGRDLEALFRERIFAPLGLSRDTTFAHRPDSWQHTVHREGGRLVLRAPMKPTSGPLNQRKGGDGLWSTLPDFLRLCAGVLRCREPGGLVSPASYERMFADAIPEHTAGKDGRSAHAELAQFLGFVGALDDPQPSDVGHSVSSLIVKTDTKGRKAGSAAWMGGARTEWCIDPKTGIAFVVMTQLEMPVGAPFDTAEPFKTFRLEMEHKLYEHLA